ncbi:peroxisomal membrane protein PEX16 [Nasonia vitripennis]|uniref:Peroxisomal membrane protein PEX16 n=1 Tax=Nasonia vitripennis TaxID=7425 RepID=A0A7M7H861_NASVI|nr:peroxisomal membrane protein PEX16 [Nasonia vitripennis]XP_016844510.1 peroxisomal membrane protein PEX16 [Nasonia vitripennis]
MTSPIKIKLTLKQWCEQYKRWIAKNPNLVSDIESTVKYVSFFTAGRLNSSTLASEFVYSLPNLMVLFNDQIIKASRNPESKLPSLQSKIKIWLTIIDYTEALFEVSAKKLWGEAGRWFIIALIQMLKVVMRLVLVFRYKERITLTPAIPPLNREKLNENNDGLQRPKEAFSLKRSGKVVRTVRSSSSQPRTWTPPTSSSSVETEELGNATTIDSLKKSLLIAETLYIVKPLLHLGCLSVSGPKNWNPWLLSFIIDLTSLKIFSQEPTLNREEREELCRRRIGLLLYILRSPFYDNCSRMRIFYMLETISKTVPLARLIAEPIARYLPHWQNTYFYMWSS